jgi:uracil-DNA glycosylase family protein
MPDALSMRAAREAVQHCEGCPLYVNATQAVFGEGTLTSEVMLVGEQPGDQEDLAGAPFVGPAGKLLDRALEEAGIDRGEVYVTNAVKHFKWERGEKSARRIHKKPNDAEIRACHPWLEEEIRLVKPDVVVCLGATAAQAIMGKSFKVTKERGRAVKAPNGGTVIATVHPSSVLRAPDADARAQAEKDFFADLKKVARQLS